VPEALRRLRDHGFRLFTLTDNTLEISGRQLENAGLIDLFERRFSVDETARRHKPAPEAYASVVGGLRADPRDICLIACHTWDTIGAVAAGWKAALVLRAGNAQLDVGPQPHLVDKTSTRLLIGSSAPRRSDAASRKRRSAGAAHRPSTCPAPIGRRSTRCWASALIR